MSIRKFAAVAAVAIAAAVGTAAPASADGDWYGCPHGYVCIYSSDQAVENSNPEHIYFTYGSHNLSNEYGKHPILNYQWGEATVSLCTGYNGTGTCRHTLQAGNGHGFNLTPINSIVLQP